MWGNTYVMWGNTYVMWGNTYVMWGNTYAANIYFITVLHKRVVRLVCGAKRLENTCILLKQLCISKLDLVKFKTAVIMFKAYHNG